MIYAPPLLRPVPAHVRHASHHRYEVAGHEHAPPLYPDRIGQVVRVLGFSKEYHAIAPVIVVFPDGERGICDEDEIR